jgi:hypothetical protein
MPKFYFHLTNQISVRDQEGRELADLEEAAAAARLDILSILSDDVSRGRMDLRGRIDIADETGTIVRSVPFADAVQLLLPGGSQ